MAVAGYAHEMRRCLWLLLGHPRLPDVYHFSNVDKSGTRIVAYQVKLPLVTPASHSSLGCSLPVETPTNAPRKEVEGSPSAWTLLPCGRLA